MKWDPSTLLLDRDFLLLWASQIFTLIGGSILALAVAFLADTGELVDHGVSSSGSAMGMVIFLNNFPSFFVAFFAGVLADWFDRKKIMLFSNIFRVLLLILFLVFEGWNFVTFAYLIIFFKSAAKQIFIPSEASIIPDIVAKKNIMSANSIFNLTNYITYLLGFILAGPLLELLGVENLVILLIVMFVLASIVLLFLRVPKREEKSVDIFKFVQLVKEFFYSFIEGLSYIYKDKLQRVMLMHNLISQAFLYIFIALVFKLGEFMINLTPSNIGIASVAPIGIGILTTVILLDTKLKNTKRITLSFYGTVIEAIAFIILSLASFIRFHDTQIFGLEADTTVLFMTVISVIIIGLGFPLLIIPAQTLIQEKTEKSFLGRVYGVWLALSQAIASIPALIVGYFADFVIGVPTTLVWISIIAVIYSIILYRLRLIE